MQESTVLHGRTLRFMCTCGHVEIIHTTKCKMCQCDTFTNLLPKETFEGHIYKTRTSIEMPLLGERNLSCKNTGELVDMYPKLKFTKYTYRDPNNRNKIYAVNPSEKRDCPIVAPYSVPGIFYHDDNGQPVQYVEYSYVQYESEDAGNTTDFLKD